ncbi:RHS repeat-associated core domain-containing protein [Tenacibaculum sp. MAR_2009_124]|uniref:RHS repeat domain-containing protein n=1 Tax=Tenacibaculum sp. MAR_2009_124 TaxID=1250059 RepID=UPI000896250C|nr:RHS repeat-associated core domain-containing protein [Tenacibaculum sp. MAR_2009_124]SEB38714.1 RHS repeat-associated core domain-containing protein [Tenacibaculum sp. MAR_2009_124]
MDDLSYHYKADKPNQLQRVEDRVVIDTHANDIKNQTTTDNYKYNSIGQLTENVDENVKYEYNASGLVTKVRYNNKIRVEFFYNDKGFRTKKLSYKNDGSLDKTTDYVLDASGSVMAIYENQQLKELPIYGASRLGVYNKNDGSAVYQITDHLGNVRATVGKTSGGQVLTGSSSSTDYYPFGMPIPNRQIINGEPYRYAYQGQEKDSETGKEAFQLRLWDARIGRWLNPDPMRQFSSPYLGMGNNPITGIDPNGGKVIFPTKAQAERAVKNINNLLKAELGLTIDAVTIKEYQYTQHKQKGQNGYVLVFNKTKEFKKMLSDLNMPWEDQLVLASFMDILNSEYEVTGELAPSTDKAAKVPGFMEKPNEQGLYEDRRKTLAETNGGTYNYHYFKVNRNLPDYTDRPTEFNIGSTIFHEILWHLSPMGPLWLKKGIKVNQVFGAKGLFKVFGVPDAPGINLLHVNGPFIHDKLKPRKPHVKHF